MLTPTSVQNYERFLLHHLSCVALYSFNFKKILVCDLLHDIYPDLQHVDTGFSVLVLFYILEEELLMFKMAEFTQNLRYAAIFYCTND